MCSKNTPGSIDFVGPRWYTSYERSIEHLFGYNEDRPSGGDEEDIMTALLDTPLPQLHPPAGSGSLHVRSQARPADAASSTVAMRPVTVPAAPAPAAATAPAAVTLQRPRRLEVPSPRLVPARRAPGPAARSRRTSTRLVPCAGATAAPSRAPLRLTRRARLLTTVSSVFCLLAVIGLAALNADPIRGSLQEAPASVVVGAGDTLWQIAAEVAPAEDPASVIRLLQAANDLDGAALQPGQVLVIPRP